MPKQTDTLDSRLRGNDGGFQELPFYRQKSGRACGSMQARPPCAPSRQQIPPLFWKMVEASIHDHNSQTTPGGIRNIEACMGKLFYKVSGYMIKHGYEDVWDELNQL